tara:strand:+ start:954 stop:1397 length:444 start_codon:yes stop_codon:yes gene_type:complete
MSFVKQSNQKNSGFSKSQNNINTLHHINNKQLNNNLKGSFGNALKFTGVSTANNELTPLSIVNRQGDFIEVVASVSDYENSFIQVGLQYQDETPYYFRTENFYQQSASSTIGVVRLVFRETNATKLIVKYLNSAGSNLNGNISVYWK